MLRKTALTGLCTALALSGLLAAACGKAHRQIVVIDSGNAEIVTWGPPPPGHQEIWAPGRTLVFRTSSPVPGAPAGVTGQPGRVYRLDKSMKMKEVGKFDPKVPNDTLAYQFGT